jgi:hypothetical protein
MMPSCCRRHWMPGDMRYENSHHSTPIAVKSAIQSFLFFTSPPYLAYCRRDGNRARRSLFAAKRSAVRGNVNLV